MADRTRSTRTPAPEETDPRVVLGVGPDADALEITQAYRRALRRTHPDTGGSDEEFHAVQEAWRALTAELEDGPRDDWDFDDWGQEEDPPEGSAAPDGTPPGTTHRDDPEGSAATESAAARAGAAARDPFGPGAVPLPEPELGGAGSSRRSVARVPDVALWAAVAEFALVALVAVVTSAPRIDAEAYGAAATWVLCWVTAPGMRRWFGPSGVVWWVGPFVVLSMMVLAGAPGRLSVASWALVVGAGGASVAAVWLLVRRSRRGAPLRAGARAAARAAHRVEVHALAGDWNRVRDALRAPGSSVERLVESVRGPGAGRWTCMEARTMRTRERQLDQEVREGAWVVFSRDGRVLATASPSALAAWVSTMKREARR